MFINFEKELPEQPFFLLRNLPEVSLRSIGRIPYKPRSIYNLMFSHKIKRIKVGQNTAIRREDLADLLNEKLNKA